MSTHCLEALLHLPLGDGPPFWSLVHPQDGPENRLSEVAPAWYRGGRDHDGSCRLFFCPHAFYLVHWHHDGHRRCPVYSPDGRNGSDLLRCQYRSLMTEN